MIRRFGGVALVALDPPRGAGTLDETGLCSFEVADPCGVRHVVRWHATDAVGARFDLPRLELGDGSAGYVGACRAETDPCDD